MYSLYSGYKSNYSVVLLDHFENKTDNFGVCPGTTTILLAETVDGIVVHLEKAEADRIGHLGQMTRLGDIANKHFRWVGGWQSRPMDVTWM